MIKLCSSATCVAGSTRKGISSYFNDMSHCGSSCCTLLKQPMSERYDETNFFEFIFLLNLIDHKSFQFILCRRIVSAQTICIRAAACDFFEL